MNTQQELVAIYREAASGDAEAFDFLVAWHSYCHAIDDEVDQKDRPEPSQVLRSHAQAALLFTCPFAVRNSQAIRFCTLLVNSAYADSVAFERGTETGLKQYADTLRHCGIEMVMLVALLTGGYDNVRKISGRLRKICWDDQHKVVELEAVKAA